MAVIPPGTYVMGSQDGDADEAPLHAVYLDAFYLDQYEVTTAQYAAFLHKTRRAEPARWSEVHWDHDRDRPVIGVDWYDADAYCRYYHKRLPTEAEWEKAARGTDGRIYPWGNDTPTDQQANFNKCCSWDSYEILAKVGSLEAGKSPYGIYNMGGNVREWVADWYDANYYGNSPSRNPPGPAQGYWKVLRGGSWHSDTDNLRASLRYRQAPEVRFNHIGFRCAQGVD
ncbi:MAG: formylglycine-generating enzyme family protein [Nitrospirota bacterium]|nr:formylglycine-generating enzyme family protein [Nitrospirota bacterium]